MAASQVSGMKMRNLLFAVILGLLAVVHSTPVNTVTQIPTKAEDEVMRQAVTEGFLVDHFSLPSLTTESPKGDTTVQASQQPSSDSTVSDAVEGYIGETNDVSTTSVSLQFSTTTQSVSDAPSSTSTVVPGHTDDSSSDSTTTQSHHASFTTSSVANEAQSSVTPDRIPVSQTTDPAVSIFHFLSTQSSDSGSGDGQTDSTTTSSMTSSSNTEASTASSISMTETSAASSASTTETSTASSTSMTETSTASSTSTTETSTASGSGEGSELGSGMEIIEIIAKTKRLSLAESKVEDPPIQPGSQNKEHKTPSWIVIVGFVVGIAALVMLFVAIATRDKWNGPSKASQQETKTNDSNQQRGLEMETFLHKDNPKENGKASEYTVIPLDELPEKYSSH
ncbi:A-agglutinin anchorage subunit-like [Sebastes umbrosus]|uniref:A-agglutinin anchorage subunit-like n=1 Tax=Sebastes umbrosus TaxID=72105 RepID=UPI00189FDD60|nr:A-agglutinin anchorage subunit-like [Sebastes umbrosus]